MNEAATPPRPIAIARRHPRLRLDRASLIRALHLLDVRHARLATRTSTLGHSGELSIAFLTDAALAQLHDTFLDDPAPTDVITFNGDPALGTAGEICVSVDAAARYAKERQGDFAAELTLYVVHGWLHLAGHDDRSPRRKRLMRQSESRAMKLLQENKCLPRFALRRR